MSQTRNKQKMVRYMCQYCGVSHEVPEDQMSQEQADMAAALADLEEKYSWESLVKRHGEEGAAIIADCLDFDYDIVVEPCRHYRRR